MIHTCKERIYYHYVFMLRNRDDDYDIPPTVVAATSNMEEAVDIMLDAEHDVYSEEKVGVIRTMSLSELYMINDEVLVWKTQSRNRRLIIWNLRQYLDRRIEDEFMSVWKAYRHYLDYAENGFENEMEPSPAEKRLLKTHMPYNKLEFKEEAELTIAQMDELFGNDEEYVNRNTFATDDIDISQPVTPVMRRNTIPWSDPPNAPLRKRKIDMCEDAENYDDLVRQFKDTRVEDDDDI